MRASILDPESMNRQIHRKSIEDFEAFVNKTHAEAEQRGLLSIILDKARKAYSNHMGADFEDALYDAYDLNTPIVRLKELSKHPSEMVRKTLSENENLPFPILINMYRDKKNKSFLKAIDIIRHNSTPDEWILTLMKDIDNNVDLGDILFRDNLPIRVLEILAYERNGNYYSIVDGNVNVQEEAKELLLDRLEEISSSNVSDKELYEMAIKSRSKTELYAIALNSNSSIRTLDIVDAKLSEYGIDIIDVLEAGEVTTVKPTRLKRREQEANPEIKSVIESYENHIPNADNTPSSTPGK